MNTPVWTPSAPEQTQLYAFQTWVEARENQAFKNYHELHAWSVQHFEKFWAYIAEFFKVPFQTQPTSIFEKTGPELWQNAWFKGATLNIVNMMLQGQPDQLAIISLNEQHERKTLTYRQLKSQVYACAQGLKEAGVTQGDRVAAMMPNTAETIIAMLATASLGAIWSSCSPDFGAHAAIDRFGQIAPKVLFICDGQHYAGKTFTTLDKLPLFQSGLPTLKKIIICPTLPQKNQWGQTRLISKSMGSDSIDFFDHFLKPNDAFTPTALPFSHPLYILFSSGTTGKPKCIVHGAGNTLLQHLKEFGLHSDLRAEDNLCFYTTCGWMMWNWMVSGLALGMTLTLYDGSPVFPTPDYLWQIISKEKVTAFGTSARYLASVEKSGLQPNTAHDFSALKLIFSTGSPLLPTQFDFVYKHIKYDVQLCSISGGTDIVSCFALGNPMLPIYRGEIQCAGLALDLQVFNEQGKAVIGQKGELVCTNPFPSMPIYFWNDPDNHIYQQAYFNRFSHTWTHGDYAEITARGSVIIYGRSDTTLKPGGVRIGSAEIYREIEQIPEIQESVVIGQPWQGDIRVLLFVKLQKNEILTEKLQKHIKSTLKTNASPRHVPDLILEVKDIPKTLNGKIVEQAIKLTLSGEPIENLSSIANPEALAYFKNRPELA